MKSVKLFITLVTVLLFCTALTACAGENREQPKQDAVQVEVEQKEKAQLPEDGVDGGQAEREREVREAEEQGKEEDRLVPEGGDDGGQAEREREAREADERAEQERQRQEEEARQREEEEHQQTGNYEHHIGDAVFYTEHDLSKYLTPNPRNPVHYLLDLEAMLRDVWGDVGMMQVSNGYAGSDGSSFNLAVSYDYVGENNKTNAGYDAKSYYFIVSVTGERQYETDVTIYNEERPSGNWIVVKGDTFGFSPDSAALLLYVLEQSISNPRSNIAGELSLPGNYECGF